MGRCVFRRKFAALVRFKNLSQGTMNRDSMYTPESQEFIVRPRFFPPPELADAEGVVGFGGKLLPEWLLDAYSHGIFPWPVVNETEILVWFSPDPRAIFELATIRPPRRLLSTMRSGQFEVTCDRDFAAVIDGCAAARRDGGGTWITPALMVAFCRMHELGHAHSIEVWHDGKLAGGTYGIAIGGLFAAESMFYRVSNASKVALFCLINHLQARGFELFDIQQLTPHTKSLGACEIPRNEYLNRVKNAVRKSVSWGATLQSGLDVARGE